VSSFEKDTKNLFNKKVLFKYALQGAVLASIVGAVIFFVTLSPDTWVELKNINWLYIVLLSCMIMLAWFCNSTRIYLLTHSINHNISFRSAMAISISTEFGVSASPGGVGGTAVRLGLLVKSGLDLPRSTALFASDVFVDCLYFIIMMPLAVFIILTDPTWNNSFKGMGNLPYIILGYMLLVIALVTLAIRNGKKLNKFAHRLLRKYGHKRRLSGRWRIVTGNFMTNISASCGAVKFLRKIKRSVFSDACCAWWWWCLRNHNIFNLTCFCSEIGDWCYCFTLAYIYILFLSIYWRSSLFFHNKPSKYVKTN
jgi:uncharacterized protein (TIRG00374 family)